MRVSVIVPLFNKEPYVARALRSILDQSFQDFEILVIDDGSTDKSAEIVRRVCDRRIRLIQQENGGPGAARNRGIAEAKGEFVAFLDADDCWLPSYLDDGISKLSQLGPEVATISSGYFIFPPGSSMESMWRHRGLKDGIFRVNSDTPAQLAVYLLAYMHPCTTIARTEVIRRYGGFFSTHKCLYGEDSYLWLKVLLNEPISIELSAAVELHTEASALSCRSKARPVEPLLTDSDGLFESCSDELHLLLREILAIRAMKTAAVLGYWGSWRQGRQLLHDFVPRDSQHALIRSLANLCASPLGSAIGSTWRFMNKFGSNAKAYES